MFATPYRRLFLIFICILLLTRLSNAAWLPPVQDEAYYFYWSRFLDFGYFDHPPLVAWLTWPGTWLLGSPFMARLGTVILSLLALPLLYSLMKRLGLKKEPALYTGLLLATGNLAAILQGYITTPDIPMIFCWIGALHEAAAALDDRPRRWLSAGIFTGLGILSKYTMLLIGPVFLIALLVRPRKLLQPWPYLGGLLCLLTILPHLLWLSQHEWITLRFQFGRGLQSIYKIQMQSGSDLPEAEAPALNGPEARLAEYFKLPDDEIIKKQAKPSGWSKYRQNFFNFIGGQLSLWGLLLLPILLAAWQRKRTTTEWSRPALQALCWAASLVPLGLFTLLSPFQQIEANWPAMYLIGAAICLAQAWVISHKLLCWTALGNLGLSLLLSLHSHWPLVTKRPHKDRLLKETHGYAQVANYLQGLEKPIFTDTYQNLSQLAFHASSLQLQQWPGIARTSELLRRAAMNPWHWDELGQKQTFLLLTDNFVPPKIPGAELIDLDELLDCMDGRLHITRAKLESGGYQRPCVQRVHRWSLAHYRLLGP